MKNLKISIADEKDLRYLLKNDRHIKRKTILKKIKLGEYIIGKLKNEYVGFLRFGYFWSAIPCIEVIGVEEEHRRKGIGRETVKFLENIAKKNKQKFVISSSTGNEKDPQNWHKKIGFKEIGKLKQLNYPSKIPEVFFIKKIK